MEREAFLTGRLDCRSAASPHPCLMKNNCINSLPISWQCRYTYTYIHTYIHTYICVCVCGHSHMTCNSIVLLCYSHPLSHNHVHYIPVSRQNKFICGNNHHRGYSIEECRERLVSARHDACFGPQHRQKDCPKGVNNISEFVF